MKCENLTALWNPVLVVRLTDKQEFGRNLQKLFLSFRMLDVLSLFDTYFDSFLLTCPSCLGRDNVVLLFFFNGARGSPKKSLNYHVICMHQNEIINSLSKVIQGHLDWSGEAHKAWSNKDLVKVIQGHLICTPVCEGWSLNPQNCSRKFFFHTERKDFQSPLHSCEKKSSSVRITTPFELLV